MNSQQEKWNRIYRESQQPGSPSSLLSDHAHLLPSQGQALDLASGLGANACFLNEKGLSTQAWDISDIALDQINQIQPAIQTVQRDIEQNPPAPNSFDVIVVSNFLYRPICSHIGNALRPGGVLFYETFCADKVDDIGPSSEKFLLKNNELLHLFCDLSVLFYQENSHYGDLNQGDRNKAYLIAAKPITNPL